MIVIALIAGLVGGFGAGLVGSNQPSQMAIDMAVEKALEGMDLGAMGTRFPNGISVGTSTSPGINTIYFGQDDATTTIMAGKLCIGVRMPGNSEQYMFYFPATSTPGSLSGAGFAGGGWATSTKSCA